MNSTDYFPPSRLNPKRAWFVAPLDDDRSGLSWNTARNSIQSAVDVAASGDYIYVAPGTYDETVTIPRGLSLSIIGIGPRDSVVIEPTTDHAGCIVCHADACYFDNLYLFSPDITGSVAFTSTGYGITCRGCKFEGAGQQVLFGPGTVAQVADDIRGAGQDLLLDNCGFSYGTNGVVLQGTDYGAAVQIIVRDSVFHNLTDTSISEAVGTGGVAANTFRNLLVQGCSFEPEEDGTEPLKYVSLNASNINTGLVTGNHFTVAINSTKNLVSTLVKWVGNWHPEGASSGQPS